MRLTPDTELGHDVEMKANNAIERNRRDTAFAAPDGGA